MYDWANSVYSLVITSAIFPVYFQNVTTLRDVQGKIINDVVNFFGFEIVNSVLYSYAVSFSFILISILSPILSSIADYSGKKKLFMQFFCYLGAISCGLLYFFTDQTVSYAVILFVTASIGFSGSVVFYNAYLPEIATEDKFDLYSARGFALGYVGSIILLVINLATILSPETFGFYDSSIATRFSFLTVGLWWFGFAQYSFRYLPDNLHHKTFTGNLVSKGFKELSTVLKQVQINSLLKKFILAFFFYNMGVQTVIYLATVFGEKELNLPGELLIGTILVLQLVAIAGSYLFSFLSKKYGNIYSLMISISVWTIVCISAYFINTPLQFIIVAGIVGLVLGGIQAISRSTYAKMIPDNTTDTASYFSFYDVAEKVSIVIGTFVYGFINHLTGSMRISSICLAMFFITGFILLSRIPSRQVYTNAIDRE